jgi:tetratricopeptide (TPR) repeat protein
MNDRLRAVWHAWLGAELAARPVVLALEDLHWGDAPTVAFVDDALRTFADRPLFVLALARPEIEDVFPKMWSERGVQPLPLRDLSKKASETIARHALGARADEGVVTEIARRAMGNPFFLEELLRSAADQKRVALPESVLALVEARLDSLDPDARRVLRAASIFGETFHAGGVRALLGEGTLDLAAWLDVLVRRESVVPRPTSSIATEAEYAFRHALVRDAAYAMLTDHDRTLGHALAGGWLESKGVRDPVLLAEHWQLAGRTHEAGRWFVAAAQARMSANDLAGVLDATKRGLACEPARDDRIALLLLRADSHRWRTHYEAAMTDASEVLAIADPRSAPWWSATAAMIECEARVGLVKEAIARADEIERATDGELTREHIVACAGAAGAFVDFGHYARADALLDACETRGAALLANDALLAAEVDRARARALLARGDIGGFTKRMGESHAAFERVGAYRYAALGLSSAAYGAMLVGHYDEAIDGLERGVALSARLGATNGVIVSKHNLGLAYLRVGRLGEALAVESEAVALVRMGNHPRMLGACLYYMSLVRHELGDFDGAEKEALGAAESCADVPPSLAEALAALAQARLSKGDLPGALESSREAKRILDEVGGIDEGEPFIRLVAAKVLHATGAIDDAKRAIVDARKGVEERASKLGDDATRASFRGVWENAQILELARAWTLSG